MIKKQSKYPIPKLSAELDKLYTLIIDSGHMPLEGTTIRDILMLLATHYDFGTPTEFPYGKLLNEIEWKWTNNRGTLIKRLDKWFHDNYKTVLPAQISSVISGTVREATAKSKVHYFDFTQNFDWAAGDFKDKDSCFWQGRKDIRSAMQKDGRFYAMRFFRKETPEDHKQLMAFGRRLYYDQLKEDPTASYTGIGRSWLFVDYIEKIINSIYSPIYILFNGYGLTTANMSQVFSAFVGLPSKSVTITNNNHHHGGLYINTGSGYLIGSDSTIQDIAAYDFAVANSHDGVSSESVVPGAKFKVELPKAEGLRLRDMIPNEPVNIGMPDPLYEMRRREFMERMNRFCVAAQEAQEAQVVNADIV